MDHDAIRNRIRQCLREKELSLTGVWLTKEPRIGQTTIRNFLDNPDASITLDTLANFAFKVGIREEWLIFGIEDGQAQEAATVPITSSQISEAVKDGLVEGLAGLIAAAMPDRGLPRLDLDQKSKRTSGTQKQEKAKRTG
ncbi:MAG: hypothetical protein ABW043_16955 [Devosia sp.]|uniref:hypothetical protein n=1 Tax=Devosia sp. TaxID=1871048 RepID=UPI00339720A1